MLKKVALVSDGGLFKSRKVKRLIENKFKESYTITHYCDISVKFCDMQFGDINIVSPAELAKLYDTKNVDIILIVHASVDMFKIYQLKEIWTLLDSYHISDIYYMSDNLLSRNIDDIQEHDIFIRLNYKEQHLSYIEIDITNHCNLSCKGCTRLCDIDKTKKFTNLETFTNDLNQVKKLFKHVNAIRILGGEPLLHPELSDFIHNARKIFPQSAINIFTNGLLLNKMSKNTLKTIKDNNAYFIIANYKPTMQIKSKIEKYLNENSMYYRFSLLVDTFSKRMTLYPLNDKYKSHEKCALHNCHLLRDGYIYKCLIVAYIEKFNKFYKTNITFKEGKYDLYDKDIDVQQIYMKLSNPIDACRYCNTNLEYFDWELTTGKTDFSNYSAHYIQTSSDGLTL